jgi:hypothetical protein
MRNLFKKTRYVEKLENQLLVQWTVIMEIDRLIQGSGVRKYQKVEIVILSQWAIFMAFFLSKVNKSKHDIKQRNECAERLRNEFDDLFIGLNNGAAVGDQVLVPQCWISGDGDSRPARMFFNQNWDVRLKRYTDLFMSGLSMRGDARASFLGPLRAAWSWLKRTT